MVVLGFCSRLALEISELITKMRERKMRFSPSARALGDFEFFWYMAAFPSHFTSVNIFKIKNTDLETMVN